VILEGIRCRGDDGGGSRESGENMMRVQGT
jgi:hypothetical protein